MVVGKAGSTGKNDFYVFFLGVYHKRFPNGGYKFDDGEWRHIFLKSKSADLSSVNLWTEIGGAPQWGSHFRQLVIRFTEGL